MLNVLIVVSLRDELIRRNRIVTKVSRKMLWKTHPVVSLKPRTISITLLKLFINLQPGIRFVTTLPPRKSFTSSKNSLTVFWHNKVPRTLAYWLSISAGCLTVANVHVNYLITLGPPLGVAGYFGYKKHIENQYKKQVEIITPKSYEELFQNVVEIPNYDEQDYKTLLNGIESEYDHLKSHIFRIIKQQINNNITKFHSMFLDSNNQVLINLQGIENFVTLSVNVKLSNEQSIENEGDKMKVDQNLPFIKLGIPFYNKDNSVRLGVIDCFLLKLPVQKEGSTSYRLKLVVYAHKSIPFTKSQTYVLE